MIPKSGNRFSEKIMLKQEAARIGPCRGPIRPVSDDAKMPAGWALTRPGVPKSPIPTAKNAASC